MMHFDNLHQVATPVRHQTTRMWHWRQSLNLQLPCCTMCMTLFWNIQGVPIKNNPLAKMLYFSHGSTNLRQTLRLCMRIFTQHILQILLK